MKRASDDLLAGSRRPENKDADIRVSDPVNVREDVEPRRRAADEARFAHMPAHDLALACCLLAHCSTPSFVIADCTRGTGRFKLAQGALATVVGLGAALSTTFGGKLIQHGSYRVSFFALGGIAAVALVLLWSAMPETLEAHPGSVATLAREATA